MSVFEACEDTLFNLPGIFSAAFLSAFVFVSYYLYTSNQMSNFYIVAGIGLYILLIFMLCIFNNIRSSNNYVMPRFAQFLSFAVKSLFGFIPFSVLLLFLAYNLASISFIQIAFIQITYKVIIWVIFSTFVIVSFMEFGKTGSILQSFNLGIMFNYSIDILIRILFMLFSFAILNTFVFGGLSYLVWIFLSLDHPVFIALCSFTFVANLLSMSHFMAQIEYDIVPREEKEHII